MLRILIFIPGGDKTSVLAWLFFAQISAVWTVSGATCAIFRYYSGTPGKEKLFVPMRMRD